MPGLRSILRRLLVSEADAAFPGGNRFIRRTVRGVGEYPDINTYEPAFEVPPSTPDREIARAMRRKLINKSPGRRRSTLEPRELRNALEEIGLVQPKRSPEDDLDISFEEMDPTNLRLRDAWLAGDGYATRNYDPYTVKSWSRSDWERLTPTQQIRGAAPNTLRGVRRTRFPDHDTQAPQRIRRYTMLHAPHSQNSVQYADLEPAIQRIVAKHIGGVNGHPNQSYHIEDIADAMAAELSTQGPDALNVPHLIDLADPATGQTLSTIAMGNRHGGNNPYVKQGDAMRAELGVGFGRPLDPEVNVPRRGGGFFTHDAHKYALPAGLAAALAQALAERDDQA